MTFTTVIRGEHLGSDIVAAIQNPDITLAVDEDTVLSGSARLLDRRISGVGTTAVVRLEIQFTADGESGALVELTSDQKLDAILAEMRALRREVATLRGARALAADGGAAQIRPGTTMLDFEIPIEEDPLD